LQIDVSELKAKGGTWEDLFEVDDEQTVQQPVVVPPVKNMVDVEARMHDITRFLTGDWGTDSYERVQRVHSLLLRSWQSLEQSLKQNQPAAVELNKAA
jgi:hypothetical protein